MIGPCLCGDPYCPSCGDPSLAKLEEAMEQLCDAGMEHIRCQAELDFIIEIMPTLLDSFRTCSKKAWEHNNCE